MPAFMFHVANPIMAVHCVWAQRIMHRWQVVCDRAAFSLAVPDSFVVSGLCIQFNLAERQKPRSCLGRAIENSHRSLHHLLLPILRIGALCQCQSVSSHLSLCQHTRRKTCLRTTVDDNRSLGLCPHHGRPRCMIRCRERGDVCTSGRQAGAHSRLQ